MQYLRNSIAYNHIFGTLFNDDISRQIFFFIFFFIFIFGVVKGGGGVKGQKNAQNEK